MGRYDAISKVLAALISESGSYTYVDKLGYSPSTDLAVYYLRESLRDFHSLMRKEDIENRELVEGAKESLRSAELEIELISKIKDRRELRRVTSLIASKALALSSPREKGGD
ncbi:MAG TPA: type I-A CRISPR-associated protein Csa5 [Euryarchaeota archaeon]|nr:type I-A CRISPR-associated protein Csa5 [Euryarchaeota archaeon]